MPLRFSADLPDGFPLVAARLDHGAQSVVDLRKFLEARAAVEKAHGKQLKKLVKKAGKNGGCCSGSKPGIATEQGTVGAAWAALLESVNHEIAVHAGYENELNTLAAELSSFHKTYTKDVRDLKSEGTKMTSSLRTKMNRLEAATKSCAASHKSVADLENQLASAVGPEQQAVQGKIQALERKQESQMEEYRSAFQEARADNGEYYQHQMPDLLDRVQSYDDDRINSIRQTIEGYVAMLQDSLPVIDDLSGGLGLVAAEINSHTDADLFCTENLSEQDKHMHMPEYIKFEDRSVDVEGVIARNMAASSQHKRALNQRESVYTESAMGDEPIAGPEDIALDGPGALDDGGGGVFMDNGGSAVYAPPETYDDGAGANDGGYDGANDGENDGYDNGTSTGVDPAAHGPTAVPADIVAPKSRSGSLNLAEVIPVGELPPLPPGPPLVTGDSPVADDGGDDGEAAVVTVEDTGVEAAAAVGAQPPIAPAVTEDGTVVTQVFARYDYEGAQEGDLSFTVGSIINVSGTDPDGWYYGELNGVHGLVPSNYVDVYDVDA